MSGIMTVSRQTDTGSIINDYSGKRPGEEETKRENALVQGCWLTCRPPGCAGSLPGLDLTLAGGGTARDGARRIFSMCTNAGAS